MKLNARKTKPITLERASNKDPKLNLTQIDYKRKRQMSKLSKKQQETKEKRKGVD